MIHNLPSFINTLFHTLLSMSPPLIFVICELISQRHSGSLLCWEAVEIALQMTSKTVFNSDINNHRLYGAFLKTPEEFHVVFWPQTFGITTLKLLIIQ